uniref:Uncharacterized protein n=1 Tax=Panagrolaimus superbus TaxID=310955 RepID=A0A914Z4G8_9BILA
MNGSVTISFTMCYDCKIRTIKSKFSMDKKFPIDRKDAHLPHSNNNGTSMIQPAVAKYRQPPAAQPDQEEEQEERDGQTFLTPVQKYSDYIPQAPYAQRTRLPLFQPIR